MAGVGKAFVANVTGQHGSVPAGGAGDGCGAGVGAAAGSMGEAVRVVPELAEDPGAEDETKAGQAVEDLGVRV